MRRLLYPLLVLLALPPGALGAPHNHEEHSHASSEHEEHEKAPQKETAHDACCEKEAHPAKDGAAHAHDGSTAVDFHEGQGLKLSPEAEAFISLKALSLSSLPAPSGHQARHLPEAAVLRTAKGRIVYLKIGDRFLRTEVRTRACPGYPGILELDTPLPSAATDVVVTGTRSLWIAEIQAVNGGVGCADGH